jgi:hypothetical protein
MWDKLREELKLVRHLKWIPQGLDIASKEYNDIAHSVPKVCLFLDGHTSHLYDAQVLTDMLYHRVLVMNYQAHATHVFQPLDSGIIRSIKVGQNTIALRLRITILAGISREGYKRSVDVSPKVCCQQTAK